MIQIVCKTNLYGSHQLQRPLWQGTWSKGKPGYGFPNLTPGRIYQSEFVRTNNKIGENDNYRLVDDSGNTIYTFDDGSTLTTSEGGEVVDFTEATDEGILPSEEDTGTTTPTAGGKGILGNLKFPLGKASAAAQTRRATPVKSPTATTSATPQGGLSSMSSQYGTGLTSGLTNPSQEYSLFGEIRSLLAIYPRS